MIIRSAERGDLNFLRDLFMLSRREAFFWDRSSAFSPTDFDRQTDGEKQWIALEAGEAVGFISVWEPDRFIHHLHVHPRFQRRGIGQALLHALPGWSENRYRLKCVTKNAVALAFYNATGFARIEDGHADGQSYILLESDAQPDR